MAGNFSADSHDDTPVSDDDQQDSSGAPSVTPGVQNFLDTMRVFFHNIPLPWQQHITTPYDASDPRMSGIEQKLQTAFKGMQEQQPGGTPVSNASHDDTPAAPEGSGLMGSAPAPTPSSGKALMQPPQAPADPPGSARALITPPAPPAPPPQKPQGPMSVGVASREPTIMRTDPSLNHLSKDANLGDAIAFLMAQSNLPRDQAVEQAKRFIAKRDGRSDLG